MTTCDSYLSDIPVPVDNNGNSDTSQNRNHPHDYVLPSFAFTNFETATVFPSHSFSSGLVFDSTVYAPLSDVAPVQSGDSTNAQHMAVMKDFSIPAGTDTGTNPPGIVMQPQGQTNAVGATISFTITATRQRHAELPMAVQQHQHFRRDREPIHARQCTTHKYRQLFRRRHESVRQRHQFQRGAAAHQRAAGHHGPAARPVRSRRANRLVQRHRHRHAAVELSMAVRRHKYFRRDNQSH